MPSEYIGGAAEAGISAGLGKAVEKIQQRDVAKEMAEFETDLQIQKAKTLRQVEAKEMAEFETDLQIQKAKTLRQVEEQFDIEAEVRARANELWKMETASRLDFEARERDRQKEYDEFLTTEKYINDKVTSGEWTPERAEGPLFMNAYQHEKLDKPEIAARLGSSPEYVQKIQDVKTQRPNSVSQQEWDLLTPEEQRKAALVGKGLEPRAKVEKEEDLTKERRQLEAIVGEVEMPSLLSLPDLRRRATEIMGETTGAGLVVPRPITPAQSGITATNPQTGERIISYDNGKTWQPLR